jgi:opacity protein-like surface antigen
MNIKLLTIVLGLILLRLSFAQISENIDIFISGGTSLPVESSIGKSLSFPQLNYFTNADFAADVLGLTPDAENFQEYWKTGFNAGAGLNYHLNSYLAILASFNYNHFEFDKNRLQHDFTDAFENPAVIGVPFNEQGLDVFQGGVNIYELKINAKVQLPLGVFRPYILAGGGYLHLNQDAVRINYYDEPFSDPNNATTIAFYDEIPGNTEDVLVANAGAGILFHLSKNFQPFIQAEYSLGLTKDQNTVMYPIKFGFNFSLR